MYAKCGMLDRSQELFDEHLVWNVVSWNILIDGYAHHGNSKETLIHLERKGKKIHNAIIEQRLIKKNIMLSTAICVVNVVCSK